MRACKCGCGASFSCKINSKKKYLRGHNGKGIIPKSAFKKRHEAINPFMKGNTFGNRFKKGYTPWNKGIRGRDSTSWKGGRRKQKNRYVLVYCPTHPYASKIGCVYEHRLVMEAHIGRTLLPVEIVHHIDGNPSNNDISNLMLFKSQLEHKRYEWEIID